MNLSSDSEKTVFMGTSSDVPEREEEGRRIKVLRFSIADQNFCVPLSVIAEVLLYQKPAPVFHTPSYCLGVTNLRGLVLGLFDMAPLLNIPPSVFSSDSRILVLLSQEREAGFVVERVTGVGWIQEEKLFSSPGLGSELIQGTLEEPSGPLSLIRVDLLFEGGKLSCL